MRKFLTIMKREYAQIVKKKSFVIMTLLTPVIMSVLMVVPSFLMSRGMKSEVETYAVIDRTGNNLGEAFAEQMEVYTLEGEDSAAAYRLSAIVTPGPDEYEAVHDSLVQAIRNKEVKYLLELHPDAHLADSNLLLVTNSENRFTINRMEYRLGKVLSRQRLAASSINLPVDSVMALTAHTNLPRENTKGESVNPMFRMLAGIVLLMLIYLLIIIDGSALMQSIIDEKTDRIMEVLVSSATPFQLMAGKIVGTGMAALTQVGIWILAGVAVMAVGGANIDPAIAQTVFNPATVVSFGMFLVFGYLLFSTFFAFVGSIVNSPKEAQSMVMPLIMLLIMPGMLIGIAAMQMPDASWIKTMSYIPTYTPLVMMMRVCSTAPNVEGNPLLSPIMGEAFIGLLLVILTTIASIWITARVFRVGILMYGKRPTLPEILKWIRKG